MSLPRFSVRQSLFINLVSAIIIISGIIVVAGMNKEIWPNVAFDVVSVTTTYVGASPVDIEKLITIPIEKELKQVDGVKEIGSSSGADLSLVYVEIDPDEKNKQKVIRDIQSAVDRVKNLPRDVDKPVVSEITAKQYPIIEVSLSGELTEQELREHAETLEDILEDIQGVARIKKEGYREREIQILVNPEKLKKYYVSFGEIENALSARNISLPAGKLNTETTEYNIRTTGEFLTVEEIEEVIIRGNDAGNWLRIKDVAYVSDTFKDERIISKTLGTRSINLTVVKKESGDVLKIVAQVRKKCKKYLKMQDGKLKISYVNDYSFFTKRRLNVLRNNAGFAVILIMTALLIFLKKRVAFFTFLGIPVAFFATFLVMNAMGITINLVSMFALIIVLGMLVDDGIIVAENVYRYMEDGMKPHLASVKGTEEVMGAIVTAVATTIAAFSPLLFMSGIMGKFIRNIPTVLIIALLASLAEALIILPSHLADFVKIKVDAKGNPIKLAKHMPWFRKLVAFYTRVVQGAIKRKWMVFGGASLAAVFSLALIFLSFFGLGPLKFIVFPSAGIEFFFARVEAPIETPLRKTEQLMRPIEDIISQLPEEELDTYVTAVGKIEEDRQDPFAGRGSNLGQITVYLTPEQYRKRDVNEILADLREKTKGIEGFTELRFSKPETGPPVGKPVEAKIRGENFNTLDQIAKEYMDYLQRIDGTLDITWDHKPGKEEIQVKVDREKASMSGLTIKKIAQTIRAVFKGGIATTIKPIKAEEETDVTIRVDKEIIKDTSIFKDILVENKFGNLIPLKKIAFIEKLPGTTTIRHLDGKRVVTVSCNVDAKKTTPLKVNKTLAREFRGIPDKYPGYSVKYAGEQEESVKALLSLLKAYFFAFLIIFLILASFFRSLIQPFIVMLAIPFGLIGVVLAFLLHHIPLSFMAILGIIGLSGIVVNDSIILVDFINKLRAKGMDRKESIIKGGQMRIRPVILTTITTVGGLSTVAYGFGGKDPFLVPMAMALCWGLLFATILTLVLIPCIYSIIDDIAIKITKHTSMISRAKENNNQSE